MAIADMPMGVAGTSGVCRFLIVEDPPEAETPTLVPISLLETWDAVLEPKHSLMTPRDAGMVGYSASSSGHIIKWLT
eukprot:9421043-Karenia_brevis.AAC.1